MTGTARLYGDSLYDLARDEQLTDEMLEQMQQIRQIFWENPKYLRLLGEPSIPIQERLGLVDTAFGESAERYLVNFIKLLCERNLLNEFAGCCEEFTKRYHKDHNIAEAVAVSAIDLSEAQRTALKSKLEAISGKTVELLVKVDPSVIGGLRIELEGKQLDGTVNGRLEGLSKKLSEIIV